MPIFSDEVNSYTDADYSQDKDYQQGDQHILGAAQRPTTDG
ncbi:hypothetical protein CgS9114_14327 [Corynebacterium glutamicum S9114]|nr:hypothetical protein CgS9114_14327 [Corynebacterium glutamicum S9114]